MSAVFVAGRATGALFATGRIDLRKTRREYILVGSEAASMPPTVLRRPIHPVPGLGAKARVVS